MLHSIMAWENGPYNKTHEEIEKKGETKNASKEGQKRMIA